MDYIVYVDGAVKQSGALAIGGDHIANDISLGLRIPMAKAERLKVEEGSVILGNAHAPARPSCSRTKPDLPARKSSAKC